MLNTETMVRENLLKVASTVPEGVRLIAVSKTKPVEMLQEAYDAGQRLFGENKALEMRDKYEALPKDIEWHMIGHLQTNKVKYIAPFVAMIHSIDSLDLLRIVEKEGAKNDRVLDCLLQFHIATEETKFGLDLGEARDLLNSTDYANMHHVRICGVMGMASFTDDMEQVRREFVNLHSIFETIKKEFFSDNLSFKEISMGMSGDYLIAIEEGATLVRVGSSIFGARNYRVPAESNN